MAKSKAQKRQEARARWVALLESAHARLDNETAERVLSEIEAIDKKQGK